MTRDEEQAVATIFLLLQTNPAVIPDQRLALLTKHKTNRRNVLFIIPLEPFHLARLARPFSFLLLTCGDVIDWVEMDSVPVTSPTAL